MNNLDKQYQSLLQDILDNGVVKGDRTGIGTKSVFGRQIRHKMSEGFPLLTTKKMYFKGIVTELIWFLRGETNIKYLVDNDCHIWDGDVYKNYCKYTSQNSSEWNEWMRDNGDGTLSMFTQEEFINKVKTDDSFATKWGDLGPIYGKQWRRWQEWVACPDVHRMARGSVWHDQMGILIHELRTNPDSRRLMVNAWNVSEIDKAVLPPCHYGFQVWTRELTAKERWEWYGKNGNGDGCIKLIALILDEKEENNKHVHDWLEKWAPNVPKRAISLSWNQRSVDTFLGLPFNIASYGLLLEILGMITNMVPDELIGNLGDTHIYLNHLDAVKEQIERDSFKLPSITFSPKIVRNFLKFKGEWKGNIDKTIELGPDYGYFNDIDAVIKSMELSDFKLHDYFFHATIKAKLNN